MKRGIVLAVLMLFPLGASANHAENGMALNGMALNGMALNGMALNGMALNGMALNGMALNGMALNGVAVNGVLEDSSGVHQTPLSELASRGLAKKNR